MEWRYPSAAAIIKKLKNQARSHPRVPSGVPPPEHYYHFHDGLSLCLTLDILPKAFGGGIFWHLSIARPGGRGLTPEEVEFWRWAFFEEEPIFQTQGLLPVLNTRHFFWRAE